MTISKRFVRLKEQSSSSEFWEPTERHLELSDGTLEQKRYGFTLDSNRFIETGVPIKEDLQSIFVLGDSFVESTFADPEVRFVAQAARLIPEANVFNAGYSGTTTLQLLTVLINKIAGLAKSGDVVVICLPMSDGSALLESGHYWNASERYAPLVPGVQGQPSSWAEDVVPLLSTAFHFCRALGLEVLLVVSPFRKADFSTEGWFRAMYKRNRANYERKKEIMERLQEDARAVAAREGVPVLDLEKLVASEAENFYDELHLNVRGQNKVSEMLAGFIRESEVLAAS
ncbi:SGNH/GDSL hydrolase family protein [Corynebacterium aquilae]|uniref:SGNH hydrolase-type esterase domain-containing protein n=1 Tax=Corynebacterium aquilae DSM 44791 TaxID=1431546 RepID=A0A1L7CII3_9CORY|nr:SGNH/GDSL hydrolase family protein [Corynebacterium aquilae]APT85671.1 hypothetical protein CAQU_12190 [Corynebacterium aquilae DSM 44791]